MIVQIYTSQSAAEAVNVARMGADYVGLTPSALGLPGEISEEIAAEAVQALKGIAVSVALSVSDDVDEIVRMARVVQPDVLHLCALPGAVLPDAVAKVRAELPGIQIMQAIAVGRDADIEQAKEYAAVADYLILDSFDEDIAGVGAAGVPHDWSVSARIVEAVDIPVILAGGLDPDNVEAAISAVQPWGVDSLTHTSKPLGDGRFKKDLDLVKRFSAAAKATLPVA